MVLTLVNEYRVSVLLSDDDLGELGVRFSDMSLRSPAFGAALWIIKDRIRKMGAEIDLSGRLLVEAEESREGTYLHFTALSPENRPRYFIKRSCSPMLFRLEKEMSASALEALFAGLSPVFYQMEGEMYLYCETCDRKTALAAAEFAEPVSDPKGLLTAKLEEYGERRLWRQ